MSRSAIRRLEDLTNRAWPPRSTRRGPGWEIRFGDGLHARRNSATVWEGAPGTPLDHRRRIEAAYRSAGTEPIAKLTEASLPGLDDHLGAAGWRRAAPTVVLTRRLGPDGAGSTPIDREPPPGWLQAFARISGYTDARRELLASLLADIALETGYAGIDDGSRMVAVGLAVVDTGYVGLFEIATDPDHRRRGLASRLIMDLLAWSSGLGATTAYLQVEERNGPALAMYDRLGFVESYRYWYRIGA